MRGISRPAEDLSAFQEGLHATGSDSLVTSKHVAIKLKRKQERRIQGTYSLCWRADRGKSPTKCAHVYKLL